MVMYPGFGIIDYWIFFWIIYDMRIIDIIMVITFIIPLYYHYIAIVLSLYYNYITLISPLHFHHVPIYIYDSMEIHEFIFIHD